MELCPPKKILQRIFPSDDLGGIRELIQGFLGKGALTQRVAKIPDSLPVVVDSSQVVHQILWAARRKRQAEARTDLEEVVDAGLITAFAPELLRTEINAKIPELAVQKGIPEEALKKEWAASRKLWKLS